jgi:hypothetical protein
MIRFFKSGQPAAFFILPVIVIALWSQGFFKQQFLSAQNTGLLYNIICKGFVALPQFVLVLLAIILITYQAIYLNILLNKYEVLYKATYLPSLFYVLMMSYSSEVILFHPVLLVNLLLLPVIDKTFSLFKNDSPSSAVFSSCFLLSLCTLIYFPSIVLLLFFFVALGFLRAFNPKEWIVALVGFAVPFYFAGVYAFYTDSLNETYRQFISQFNFYRIERAKLTPAMLSLVIYFGFLFLISLTKLRVNFYKNSIRSRSELQALFIFLLLGIISSFFFQKLSLVHFNLLAIPVSVMLGYLYASSKRRTVLTEISFWVLVGLIVHNYF